MNVLNLPGNGVGKTVSCKTHSFYTFSDNIKSTAIFGLYTNNNKITKSNEFPLSSNLYISDSVATQSWLEQRDKKVESVYYCFNPVSNPEIAKAFDAISLDVKHSMPTLKSLFTSFGKSSVEASIYANAVGNYKTALNKYIDKLRSEIEKEFNKQGQGTTQTDQADASQDVEEQQAQTVSYTDSDGRVFEQDNYLNQLDELKKTLSKNVRAGVKAITGASYQETEAKYFKGLRDKLFQEAKDWLDKVTASEYEYDMAILNSLVDVSYSLVISFLHGDEFLRRNNDDLSQYTPLYVRSGDVYAVVLPESPQQFKFNKDIIAKRFELVGVYATVGCGCVVFKYDGYHYAMFNANGISELVKFKGLPYISIGEGSVSLAQGFDNAGCDHYISDVYSSGLNKEGLPLVRDEVYPYYFTFADGILSVIHKVEQYLPVAVIPLMTNRCFIDSITTVLYHNGEGGLLPGGISADVIQGFNTYIANECIGLYGTIDTKKDYLDGKLINATTIKDPFLELYSDAHSAGSLVIGTKIVNGRKVLNTLSFTTRTQESRDTVYLLFNDEKSIGNSYIAESSINDNDRLSYSAKGVFDISKMRLVRTSDIYYPTSKLSDIVSDINDKSHFRL